MKIFICRAIFFVVLFLTKVYGQFTPNNIPSNFPTNFPTNNFPTNNFPTNNFPNYFPNTFPNSYGNIPQMNYPGSYQQMYFPQTNSPQTNSGFLRQCALESGVSEEELNRFKNRDFNNLRANIHCFANCILERMGLIQNGEIAEQRIVQILSPSFPLDQLTQRVTMCRTQSRGLNRCESSYRFYVCLSNSSGNSDIFRLTEIRN